MKKFTSLLLLLLTMFLWGGVNVVAQTFEVSGAPSNGQWAENTHWYTITLFNNSDFYFRSDEDGTDPDGNLLLRETTKSADALWCVVKDGDNYAFYNYVDGPSKVLGSTGSTTGKEGSGGRLKMYAKGTEGVVTSYTRANGKYSVSGDADAFCEPSTNHYFNYRDGYLSFWNSNDAAGGKGSACRLVAVNTSEIATLVSSSYDAIVAKATSVKNGMNGHVGELFAYSQENYDKLISLIPATKPASVEDQVKAVRALKEFFATVEAVMPETGYYTLKNYSRGKYLDAPFALTNSIIASTNDNYQSEAWLLTKNDDGTYSLKNYITGSYISGSTDTQNFNVSTNYSFSSTAQNFKFYPNYGGRALTAVIGTGNQCRNISVNESGTVTEVAQGNKIGEDCSWSLVKVDNPTTLNGDANANEALKIARLLPVLAGNVNTTLTAYAAERSETNATAFADAVNASSYIRVKNVGTSLGLGASSDKASAWGYTWSNADAGLIWKLEAATTDQGVKKLKLHHLNTNKYMGTIGMAASAGNSRLVDNFTDGTVWDFTNNGSDFTISNNGAVMHSESNGGINQWNQTNHARWYVTVATDIQVDLNEVNGKFYATAYLPFPVSAVAGAKAYVGTFNDAHTAITLTEKTEIPAKEGVVLISDDAAATATLTIGGNAVKEGTNAFSGTNTAITLSDENRGNFRVLGPKVSDPSGIGFFKPSSSVESIPANRAYVEATSTSTASSVSVNFGTVEGLGSIVTETSEDANSPIYDLSGRRVMHTVKGGLYIRNGKKFLVK